MTDKTWIAVAAVVLIVIGVLVFNAACDQCLFEYPAGGAGGGVSVPVTPEQTGGIDWMSVFIVLIPIILVLYACRAGNWLDKISIWPKPRFRDGVLKGVVTDDTTGDNIEGVTVSIESSDGTYASQTNTSQHGYRVVLSPGHYRITVSKNGWEDPQPPSQEVDIKARKETEANFTLKEISGSSVPNMCTISGTVSDLDGNLIENATVTLSSGAAAYTTATDSSGQYSVSVPPGHWKGHANKPGYIFTEAVPPELDINDGESKEMHFKLKKRVTARKTDVIPPEIMGTWRNDILDGKYCGNFKGKIRDFIPELLARMRDAPYPLYLIFKGWISRGNSRSQRGRIIPFYGRQYWDQKYSTFEMIIYRALESVFEPYGTLRDKDRRPKKGYVIEIVKEYTNKNGDLYEDGEKTYDLSKVFITFATGSLDETYNEINSIRNKMGAPMLDRALWDRINTEIISKFYDTRGNLHAAYEEFVSLARGILDKTRRVQTITGRAQKNLKDDILKDISNNWRYFEERLGKFGDPDKGVMTKIKKEIDSKFKGDPDYDEVITTMAQIYGPPTRIMVEGICLLNLVKLYCEYKDYSY